MSELKIQREIQTSLSRGSVRLWRNNVGEAWQGESIMLDRDYPQFGTRKGDVLIKSPRRVAYGLAEGSADLIGLVSTVVTQSMVGKTVAVFAAIEVKSQRGATRAAQDAFIRCIKSLGGLAGKARSVDEAKQVLEQ